MWNFIFIPHVQAFVFQKKISKTWMFNVVAHLDVGTSMTYLPFLLYTSLSLLLSNWTLQSVRTQFLDLHIFVQSQMNFGVLGVINSCPQLDVRCTVVWRSLNYAFSYCVILDHLFMGKQNCLLVTIQMFCTLHACLCKTIKFFCKTDEILLNFSIIWQDFCLLIMFYLNLFSSCFSLRL